MIKLDFKKSNLQLKRELNKIQAYDIAELFYDLEESEQTRVLDLLDAKKSSEVFSRLSEYEQVEVFAELNESRKKRILNNLEVDELKEFIGFYEKDEQEAILKYVDEERANIIRDLLIYSSDLAPSIMTTEFLSININLTVKEATSYIFNNSRDDLFIDNIYVVNDNDELLGVLFLKDLIIARANDAIDKIMISDCHYAYNDSTVKEAIAIVRNYDLTSLAVINHQNELLGIITADDVLEQLINDYDNLYHKFAFLPEHDDAYTGLQRSAKRLPWLIIATVLNILIAILFLLVPAFELTLSQVFALVLFQPLVLDMAGNIGTQNLAVTILGIHKNELSNKDDKRSFLRKELLIIIFNCIIVAVFGFLVVSLFSLITNQTTNAGALIAPYKLGLVVSASLFAGMFISGLLGTILPIFFTSRNLDSDNASGPILTTVADIVPILTYYLIAAIMLLFL
ncbi:MAG: magnesium transporter [Acholeplasmataceae bacterium]|jgi:magnesium transporter